MNIQQSSLFHDQALVAGQWVNTTQQIDVINPASLDTLGSVPRLTASHVQHAIESAHQNSSQWQNLTAHQRSEVLMKWYHLVLENLEELAIILTSEQGKPLSESRSEIRYAASFIQWFAEEAKRAYGDVIPSPFLHSQIIVTKHPIGIVAAITPWNFPAAMITRKMAPALAAGCACIIKPALETPYTALALADLALRAGVSPTQLSVLTGDAEELCEVLLSSKLVKKISFTGSTAIGKLLYQQAAPTLKKLALELGGNAPFIVFDDAHLEDAVEGALMAKFRNAGQTCVCVNRFYVHTTVYDQFIERFTKKINELTLGDGLDPHTHIGPLISQRACEKVQAHVDNAIQQGARLVTGGYTISHLKGHYYAPTLIADANPTMHLAHEETFGPLAAIFKFEDEQQVIELANATDFGLAAYCYTQDLGRAWRISQSLEYGMVGLNTGSISTEVAPFGGIKFSGLGREGSKYGLDEFLELKYSLFAGLDRSLSLSSTKKA